MKLKHIGGWVRIEALKKAQVMKITTIREGIWQLYMS